MKIFNSDYVFSYVKSKWAGEKLLKDAAAKGYPFAVYRPGLISGNSKTGVTNGDDFYMRLLKGCIQLGASPDWPAKMPLCPVDMVRILVGNQSSNN